MKQVTKLRRKVSMSNEQEIKGQMSKDGNNNNPELQNEATAVSQKHADHYIAMLMNPGILKHDLQQELDNINLAIARLNNGEVNSEYTPEQLEERLNSINFSRMSLRNPNRN
jgi:hypothetical protein